MYRANRYLFKRDFVSNFPLVCWRAIRAEFFSADLSIEAFEPNLERACHGDSICIWSQITTKDFEPRTHQLIPKALNQLGCIRHANSTSASLPPHTTDTTVSV